MDEEMFNSMRRMSTRTRKIAPKMAAALSSNDNNTQAILARLEALENDNAVVETIQIDDDDDASLDDDDQAYQKKQSKSTKRKTRQAKAPENAKKAPRTYLELLQEVMNRWEKTFRPIVDGICVNASVATCNSSAFLNANLESLPPHVPTYTRAAVGTPSSTARRHFCRVCGFSANYTCVQCGMRFCAIKCQNIHNDTRCLKFVA